MDTAEFLWRVVLLVAAVAAAIYFVVLIARLRRLRPAPGPDLSVQRAAGPAPELAPELVFVAAPVVGEPAAPGFEEHLAWTQRGSELRDLRAEMAVLREELATLRERVAELEAARRISPFYADAAELARRGFDARGVAEECGISVAEAELVLAMSSDTSNFDDEVHDDRTGQGDRIESPGR